MEEKTGIVRKLAAIRRELRNIEKRGHNAHFNYDFMRAQDVAGDIGDALAAQNIVLGKENLNVRTDILDKGVLYTVSGDLVFVDGDTSERLVVSSAGAGFDSTDKGVYKALTGFLKYALTQALCMRVGDDPEEDGGPVKAPQNGYLGLSREEKAPRATDPASQGLSPPIPENARRATLTPEPPKKELGVYPISQSEIGQMEARCKATGKDMANVLKYFKVEKAEDLMGSQFTEFCHMMDRMNAGKKP